MTTQEETEFDVNSHSNVSNDNVTITSTRMPHCQVKFEIKVSPQATQAAYQKALKNINKEVSIPGFRKGKAPEKIIIERYQPTIQKEFVDLVLNTGFNEALQLTHIHPLKDGQMKRPVIHECSREKGAHFEIEFEARPAIPAIKLDELEVPKIERTTVTDQERKNALEQVVLQFTTYEPVEDRPVEENDFVNISVTILEEPPREVIQNQRAQVSPTGMPSWMREKVIGLQAGESVEGMTEQDPNLTEPSPDFQPLPFRATIHTISKGLQPEVNDELAKRVGVESLDDLHKKIEERLEQEHQEDAYRAEIQALEQALLAKYPIDLPQTYIQANKQMRLEDYLNQLEKQGRQVPAEEYEHIDQMIEQSTIYHLQLFFLLRKVAHDNHLTVEQEDITQELTRQLALLPSGRSALDLSASKEKLREQLENLALDRKIKQFLISHVRFV